MGRILAYTSPARGHLFPVVPILDELRRRGHEIAVRTLASEVERMEARGFVAAPIDPALPAIAHDDFGGGGPVANLRRSVRVFARRATIDAADLRRAIAETDPTTILVDVNAWGSVAAAEAHGAPWATWCPFPLPIPSRDAPPFGPGLPPAAGAAGRLRDRVVGPLVMGSLERIAVPRVNAVRASLGLPPVADVTGMYAPAPLTLALTAPPFEYPRTDWPASVRLVGPCDWDPPAEPPDWLAAVEAPLVLVTTSSEFQDDGALVETALEALADEPVHVVATMPAGARRLDVPANAHVVEFLPHGVVLDRAVCAVTHGGMGATQKALARGVPVVAVPFGRDQLEVARRVEVAGAGTRLPASRLRPDRLRAAVRTAMGRRAGAERVADAFREAGGAVAAAGHVEALLPRDAVERPTVLDA